MIRHSTLRCAGARECVSLELDGELSRLERARLEHHLARCAGCRAFAASVRVAVEAVRTAPPERPARPVQLPPRHRSPLARPLLRLAAPALAAVAVAAAVTPTLSHDSRNRLLDTTPVDLQREVDAMREYQRDRLSLRLEHALGVSSKPFQRPPGVEVPPQSLAR